MFVFFFSSRRRHTRLTCDWSSDVCSSDLRKIPGALGGDGFVPGIPRLGIPDLNLIGAGLGATDLGHRRNGQSTALPSSLVETSSWDPEIGYEAGKVIGEEARDEGFNVSLGGGIDVTRELRNGR